MRCRRPSKFRRFQKTTNSTKKYSFLLILLLSVIIGSVICLIKSQEAFDLYLQSILPFFLWGSALTIMFPESRFLHIAILLQLMGSILQSTLQNYMLNENLIFYISTFLIALLFKNYQFEVKWQLLGLIDICLFLLIVAFGVDINGTKAWVSIVGFSFQATELIKLCVIIMLGSVFSKKEYSDIKKFILALSITLLNVLGLAILRELGTGIMIGMIFMTGSLLFLEKRYIVWTLVGFVIGTIVLFLICFIIHANYDFLSSTPISSIASLFEKISNRVLILFQPEMEDLGYQSLQAKYAVMTGGVFGSKEVIHVPAGSTDLALISLVLNFGITSSIVYICLFMKQILGAIDQIQNNKAREKRSPSQQQINNVSMLLLMESFLRMTCMIFCNLGVLPLVGLPFPYISNGLTAAIALWICNMYYVGGVEYEKKQYIYLQVPGLKIYGRDRIGHRNLHNDRKVWIHSRSKSIN